MKLYRLAEQLSRGITFRRRLPAPFGSLPIYVSPEASLRYWGRMSSVDPFLYGMALELVRPGKVVWDIGANVGLFSFSAAALATQSGFVLAIEPDVWLSGIIAKSSQSINRTKYKCAPIEALCAAVSDKNRIDSLHVANRSRASNYLGVVKGSTQANGARQSQPVSTVTLDFLLDYFSPPNVLKIDVETHEAGVLQGATRVLREARPIVWCEVSPENSHSVFDLLRSADYEIYNAGVPREERTVCRQAPWNTLGIPKA
jgi:FkbM family methyltransferase